MAEANYHYKLSCSWKCAWKVQTSSPQEKEFSTSGMWCWLYHFQPEESKWAWVRERRQMRYAFICLYYMNLYSTVCTDPYAKQSCLLICIWGSFAATAYLAAWGGGGGWKKRERETELETMHFSCKATECQHHSVTFPASFNFFNKTSLLKDAGIS